jgi:hypothetical protein
MAIKKEARRLLFLVEVRRLSWSLALNGITDFLLNSFAVSKENSFSLCSFPLEL